MRTIVLALLLLLMADIARLNAQQAAAIPVVVKDGTSPEGGLKTTISVTAKGLSSYLVQNGLKQPKFVLYLNEIPFKGLSQSVPDPGHDHVQFYLDRLDTNRDQWAALLRSPVPARRVLLTIGLENGLPFNTEMTDFSLVVYHPAAMGVGVVLLIVLLVLFCWAARASDVLRQPGPPPAPVNGVVPRKAYSLARVQMAVWFFVVVGAFALIWIITWDRDTISNSVLALIGISAATGLAGTVVDTGKASSLQAQKKQLTAESASLAAAPARQAEINAQISDINRQLTTPATEHFIIDILSDANGISFHRFQMAVWTAVLAIVFIISVWKDLLMPDFNTTLLGLMGISAGTYIGFKFPEVNN